MVHEDEGAARSWLIGHLAAQRETRAGAELGGDIAVTKGIPRLTSINMLGRPIAAMTFASWEFLVIDQDKVALASVAKDDDFELTGLLTGVLAERVLYAASLAVEKLVDRLTRYVPILFDASELQLAALVLKANSGPSWSIDVLDGAVVDSDVLSLRLGIARLRRRMTERTVYDAPGNHEIDDILGSSNGGQTPE